MNFKSKKIEKRRNPPSSSSKERKRNKTRDRMGINRVSIDRCIRLSTSTGTIAKKSQVLWWEAKLSLSRAQLIIKAAAGQSNFHARPYPSFVRPDASQCLAKFRENRHRPIFHFSLSLFLPFPSPFFLQNLAFERFLRRYSRFDSDVNKSSDFS